MPIAAYFKGKGQEVLAAMRKRYGAEKGEDVFYATANKRGQTPKKKAGGLSDRLAALRLKGRFKKRRT